MRRVLASILRLPFSLFVLNLACDVRFSDRGRGRLYGRLELAHGKQLAIEGKETWYRKEAQY